MIVDILLSVVHGKWCLDGVPYSGETKSLSGTLRWYNDGRYHREDGPAIVYADGTKEWRIHGKCHREDGPAVERANGTTVWYIHGKQIFTWKEYHELSTLSPQDQMIVKLKYGEHLK